jgi:hypothetical protein
MSDNLPSVTNPSNVEISKLTEHFPILSPSKALEVRQIGEDNLGLHGLSERELDHIKVPSGGGLVWEIPSLAGGESARELSGIIVAWRDTRLYWRTSYAEGGKKRTPPDCISQNGFTGIGDPGGDCTVCPFAQFGSDPKSGRGQACRQIRQLMFLRADQIVPDVINVPATSRKNALEYFRRLYGASIPYWGLITNLKLERTNNADGVAYARVVFTAGEHLNTTQRQTLMPYHTDMERTLRASTIDTTIDATTEPEDYTPPRGQYSGAIDD